MRAAVVTARKRRSPKSNSIKTEQRARERTPNDPLKPGEVSRLIESTSNLKDRTLFILGFSTGMRVGEISQIDESWIQLQESAIRVWDEKKDRPRIVYVSDQALSALRLYLNHYPAASRRSPLLFPGYSAKTIERRIQESTSSILGKKRSWHAVRHTYISLSREQDIPMEIVIASTGDSPVTILKYYSRFSPEAVRKKINEKPLFRI